jgi:prenylcysteine oxidase/farnesylcysteine lyase
MDSWISTMETNALMGKNVARLIVDRMLAGDGEDDAAVEDLGEDIGQRVLEGEL